MRRYFAAILCFLLAGVSTLRSQTAYVDFGSSAKQSGNPDANGRYWNNATDATATASLPNLKWESGAASGISLTTSSTAVNPNGTTVPDAAALGGLAIASATSDSFFAGGTDRITVTLSNLSPTAIYRLSLFASRDAPDTRITRYDVVGQTSETQKLKTSGTGLNTSAIPNANRSALAVFQTVRANSAGKVVITVSVDSGPYAYIGALRLENTVVANYPPVANNVATTAVTMVGSEVTGQYTYSDVEGNAESGTQFVWERTTNPVSGTPEQVLAPGIAGLTWTLPASMRGYYYRLGVIPSAASGETQGSVSYSAWMGPVRFPTSKSIFHIGNSFTRWTNIPQQVNNLGVADNKEVVSSYQVTDGQSLAYHWDNGLGNSGYYGVPSRQALVNGEWDCLVLQPYSTEWQSSTLANFKDYARRFYQLADANDTQVYLYAYWPYSNQDLSTQTSINTAFEQVRQSMSAGGQKPAIIIPVGEAFRAVCAELGTGPFVGMTRSSLYRDERHPSDIGGYISALTHYATIFQKSPVGLPARTLSSDATSTPVNLNPAMALRIQEIVWNVVRNFPNSGVGPDGNPLPPAPTIVTPPVVVPPPNPPATTTSYVTPQPYVEAHGPSDPALLALAFGPAVNGQPITANLPHNMTSPPAGKAGVEYTINAEAENAGATFTIEWSNDLKNWTLTPPTGFQITRTGQTMRAVWTKTNVPQFMRVHVVPSS